VEGNKAKNLSLASAIYYWTNGRHDCCVWSTVASVCLLPSKQNSLLISRWKSSFNTVGLLVHRDGQYLIHEEEELGSMTDLLLIRLLLGSLTLFSFIDLGHNCLIYKNDDVQLYITG